jgi:hypothetical protein
MIKCVYLRRRRILYGSCSVTLEEGSWPYSILTIDDNNGDGYNSCRESRTISGLWGWSLEVIPAKGTRTRAEESIQKPTMPLKDGCGCQIRPANVVDFPATQNVSRYLSFPLPSSPASPNLCISNDPELLESYDSRVLHASHAGNSSTLACDLLGTLFSEGAIS